MPTKSAKRQPTAKKKVASKPLAANAAKAPVASRPVMPAVYGVSKSAKGLLEWGWAVERLVNSHNYVIVTVRPDGHPHAMGMHGLWFEDAFYFGTTDATCKAKNLARNPNCILINERLDELIIVEGMAENVSYDALPRSLSGISKKKYGWGMDPRSGGVVYKVIPKKVFALPEKLFATAPTRWLFP